MQNMTGHQVHLNAVACISEYGQSEGPPIRCSSKFMKFTTWSQLSLLISCKPLIPSCCFENVFPAYFGIDSS
jgi:hypothetical protein